jgi:hypothetical protein
MSAAIKKKDRNLRSLFDFKTLLSEHFIEFHFAYLHHQRDNDQEK